MAFKIGKKDYIMDKLLWVDVESTGLDPKKQDIIQIAGLVEINHQIVEEISFRCQPFDYSAIEMSALEVNHVTVDDLKKLESPKVVYTKLMTVLDKYVDRYNKKDKFIFAGYNVGFDIAMMQNFFLKNGNNYFGSYCDYHKLDVAAIVLVLEYMGLIRLEGFRLINVAKYLRLTTEDENSHDALADIKLTREVFFRLQEYIKPTNPNT